MCGVESDRKETVESSAQVNRRQELEEKHYSGSSVAGFAVGYRTHYCSRESRPYEVLKVAVV